MNYYCPSANDLLAAYGNPVLQYRGWTITGGAGAATKASFNLLQGSVEFDIDFSGTRTGVNANIYTISPTFYGSFSQGSYCDGAKTGAQWCVEADWIETNGNCGGASALHTRDGTGNNGCTAWGCKTEYYYNGKPSFHMAIHYDAQGNWQIYRDGVLLVSPSTLSPSAQALDLSTLVGQYQQRGAVIYSSQWVGWVPVSSCGTSGSLTDSTFRVSNLKIYGSVVQGPAPALC